jgi:ABC-type sugar transport system ATPase subunit
MTSVTIEHVTKSLEQQHGGDFRQVTVVDNVSLKIVSGDVLVILGPSGSGKSTLLRLIAGLLLPDAGHILYDNVDLREIPLKERGIGMVFQNRALMPHWEAGKSVGFFLWLRHREAEVPARVHEIAQITGVGLQHLMGRMPARLSGGEQQRVAIARALARDPRLFLFDEPFSNLDAKLRAQARVELKRLLHEFPVTSVYVTHDQSEATALASRVAVMREGRLEQVGTYHTLYENPTNLFIARFIGAHPINLFEGRVIEHHWQGLAFGGFPIRTDLEEGAPITLGIRPEYIQLAPDGVPAVVESVTPFFGERHQLVEVGGTGGEHWRLVLPIDAALHPGETVTCTLDPAGILYFDPNRDGVRVG